MNKWLAVTLAVAFTAGAGILDAGGWAVVTVGAVPDSVVAGRPFSLDYAVRQHGQHLVANLPGRITARLAAASVEAVADSDGRTGHYAASLTLPTPGVWTITIRSGFTKSTVTLPMTAVAPGDPLAAAPPLEILGKRLFTTKGCATCHRYARAQSGDAVTTAYGPRLDFRVYSTPFLERVLADPTVLPRWTQSPFAMPNLGLNEREIAAIAAFMTSTTN
jgi:mono/diheme cytochrome c family protein